MKPQGGFTAEARSEDRKELGLTYWAATRAGAEAIGRGMLANRQAVVVWIWRETADGRMTHEEMLTEMDNEAREDAGASWQEGEGCDPRTIR